MNIEYTLLLIILLPVVALLSFTSPRFRGALIEKISLASLILVFALVCSLYPHVKKSTIYFQFPDIMGVGLYLKLDMLRYILVLLSSFIWILCYIYSTHYVINYKNKKRYFLFFMLTLPTTLGVFMSENILNLFTFFELMTVSSYFLVIQDEDKYTHKAGFIYIIMSIGGGLVQLMGIFLLYDYTSTLMLSEIPMAIANLGHLKYVIAISIIIGFGVKACMFPLHIWLPKVYSPTPSPATAIFSAILTKTGIFGILLVLQFTNFDKTLSMLVAATGLINMFIGGLLAMHHRNIKKTFAYSSMSQIGYIFLSISIIGLLGEHGANAYYASIFHMVTHALTKTIIFLGCGVAIFTVGDMSLSNIRGFGQDKPLYKFCFLIGLLGTAGIPGFSGFASKTMIHHAVTEATHMFSPNVALFIEAIFFISSAFTVVYCLKIYLALFVEKYKASSYELDKSHTKFTLYPMFIISIVVIILGIGPKIFLNFLGYHHANSLHFYTIENLVNSFYIFVAGFLIYSVYAEKRLKVYIDKNSYYFINPTHEWFDLERDLYGPILTYLFTRFTVIISILDNALVFITASINSLVRYIFSLHFFNDIFHINKLTHLYIYFKIKKISRKNSHNIQAIISDTFSNKLNPDDYKEKIQNIYDEKYNELINLSASVKSKTYYLGEKLIDLSDIQKINSETKSIKKSNFHKKAFYTLKSNIDHIYLKPNTTYSIITYTFMLLVLLVILLTFLV